MIRIVETDTDFKALGGLEGKTVADLVAQGKEAVILGRVSTSKQKKGLGVQMEYLREWCRQQGLKVAKEFSMVGSGKKASSENLKEAARWIESRPEPSMYVLVVRNVDRWARNTSNAIRNIEAFGKAGVSTIIADNAMVVGPDGSRQNVLIFEILSSVATHGKAGEELGSRAGIETSKGQGVATANPKEFYSNLKRSPIAYLARQRAALKAKDITKKSVYEKMPKAEAGLGKDGEMLYHPGTYWMRETLKRMDEIEEKGGPALLAKWLKVVDAVFRAEKQRGVRKRTKGDETTKKARALHRVTGAFLEDPDMWPSPLEGNPDISPGHPGTIEDALASPRFYKAKRAQ